MVEFNFKSQRATTIEQSERLIALGLRKETADMTHHYLHSTDSYELEDIEFSRIMHLQELVNKKPVLGKSGDDLFAKDIPAWGLHRLIEILDTNPYIFYTNCGYDTVIDHVEEYIRSGFIDTRYLKEWCLKEMVIRRAENSPYILLCTSHSENVTKELLEKLGIKYKLTISNNGVRYFILQGD